jgi:hypothetical protein
MRATGYSAVELVFAVGLAVTLAGVAVPEYRTALDDFRTAGAARYVAARLQRARMDAVARSAFVALQFTTDASGYTYAVYVDGNGNGVLARDIARGIDKRTLGPERLSDLFAGVEFGALPSLPPVDAGGTLPGSDPVRLGTANSVSFGPMGTSTSGTLYIRGRGGAQYAARVYGDTGKTRLLKFDRGSRRWNPL